MQKLNGKNALAFVRFRDYVNGDIDRTAMQQTFIKAPWQVKYCKPKTITKLPKLVSQINQYVNTNMGVKRYAAELPAGAPPDLIQNP